MKPKNDFSEDENYKYLMLKKGDPIKSGQVFPLGYTDKRDKKKKKKRRSKKSLNSSKSGSSESIEEINEEFEDENYDYINKNNSDPGKSGTDMIINDENFKLFPKEEDSDSEIVEETTSAIEDKTNQGRVHSVRNKIISGKVPAVRSKNQVLSYHWRYESDSVSQ